MGSEMCIRDSSKLKSAAKQVPGVRDLVRQSSSSSSKKSHSSQLVDLVVEDKEAAKIERVRARKEGGPGWNDLEQKHFIKTFPDEPEQEEVRQGFNPDKPEKTAVEENHTLDEPFTVGEDDEDDGQRGVDETGHEQPWEQRTLGEDWDGKGKGLSLIHI